MPVQVDKRRMHFINKIASEIIRNPSMKMKSDSGKRGFK